MIAMPVRDQDQIDFAQGFKLLVFGRRLGIIDQERIDDNHLASGRGDLGGRLAQSLYFNLAALRRRCRATGQEHAKDQCRMQLFHVFLPKDDKLTPKSFVL
jgi:hypothetical protein